jgi:REP element-mobilizing transposase RayT
MAMGCVYADTVTRWDRCRYVARLREMSQRFALDVLDYMVTSNHVHLLIWAGHGGGEV